MQGFVIFITIIRQFVCFGCCAYSGGMDSLQNLLAGRTPQEPPAVRAIKAYVRTAFDRDVQVMMHDDGAISILAANAALANAIRLRLHAIRQLVGDDVRLSVRIGRAA